MKKMATHGIPSAHTVSFLFNFSGLKKLVKWSGYEIQIFTTNFGEKLVFYKSF